MGRRWLTATSASSRQSNANANSPGDGLHRDAARKSAWVRHLAGRMGIQVLQKRASDLLNAFLGGSERNIANACPRFYTQKPLPTRVGVYEKMIKFIETVGEVR